MISRCFHTILLGALLVVLVGCSSETSTPTISKSPAGSTVLAATPTLLPRNHTPLPNLGIVQGILFREGQPAAEQTMYLATVIREGSEIGVAALDPVRDPRAETDASGYFVFQVPPGRYALGIMSPAGPVLIRKADDEIIVEVKAGQIADLGTVSIEPFVR